MESCGDSYVVADLPTYQSAGPPVDSIAMVPLFDDPENIPSGRVIDVWATLAPQIAGRPRMRVARDGKNFTARDERDLSSIAPTRPAAVMLYDAHARCRVLALDFDLARAGAEQMHEDVLVAHEMLTALGVVYFTDYSPSGGEHFYLPLQDAMELSRALPLVNALACRFPSLDPGPHRSAVSGCIRVPGSAHKIGGHQILSTPMATAERVAKIRNTEAAMSRLEDELAQERLSLVHVPEETTWEADETTKGPMGQAVLQIARTGMVSDRYASPSEARFAVVISAVRSGLDAAAITMRMHSGVWPGLRQLYAKYQGASKTRTLQREVTKARRILAEQPEIHVRKYTTSQPITQGGVDTAFLPGSQDEYRYLRSVRNAMHIKERAFSGNREGIQLRLVLRAAVESAFKVGSRFIEFGARAMGLAAGLEHTTVSKHLRTLRQGDDPFLVLLEPAQGTRADQYRLRVPDGLADAAFHVSFRAGKQYALRPVFRLLGATAALALEAVEHSPGTVIELSQRMGLARSTVYEALATLAAWNLAELSHGQWSATGAVNLELLGETLGADVLFADQQRRYAKDRQNWRKWLATRHTVVTMPIEDDYPFELFDPGAEDDIPEFLYTT